MANVNVAQLRSSLTGLHPGRIVNIHAAVLKAILDAYKLSAGSEVAVSTVTTSTSEAPLDLTRF